MDMEYRDLTTGALTLCQPGGTDSAQHPRGHTKNFPVVTSLDRDVTAGATGATTVAPKFSDALTLFQPGGDRLCPTLQKSHKKFRCGYISGVLSRLVLCP